MINLVRVDFTATEILLETAAFLESKSAEFLGWRVLCHGANEMLTNDWSTAKEASDWIHSLTNVRGVELDFRSIVNPHLGSTEELSSLESTDPVRAGSTMTLSISGEMFCDEAPNRVNSREFGRIFEFLVSLAENLDLSYGSLTVEYVLESAFELAHEPNGHVFRDYFITGELLD
jgi:hypothetical protein